MISFIVPAYNEERLLARTLDSIHYTARLLSLTYEVIVVDDGSTDGTAAVAESHGCRVLPVSFRQISRTRNAGARAARGRIFIFVDADTVIGPATVRTAIEAVNGGAVGGGADVVIDGRVPIWASLMLVVVGGFMRANRWAAGCFVFCSRAAFESAGGFDERLFAAEEIAFSRRLKRLGRVVILPDPVTSSGRKLRTHSLWDIFRQWLTFVVRGPASLRSRERLPFWYDERRDDPDSDIVSTANHSDHS